MHCPTTQGQVAVSSSSSEGSVPGINNETLFADLCILVVEGRLTTSNGGRANKRGYEEGPHCMVAAGVAPRHLCNVEQNFLCARVAQLRRHASLLWQNGVPACIDVLLCPECPCGFARSLSSVHATSNPALNNSTGFGNDLLLLEQWRISPVQLKSGEIGAISPHGLIQALRSQLHFSQLSAWYSRSAGANPSHVHYRVTVPEVAHRSCGSQFERSPVEHTFPLAIVAPGQGLQVYVRSLPRAEEVPRVTCPIHQGTPPDETSDVPANVPTASQTPPSLAKRTCVVASSSVNSSNGSKENRGAALGESLLDPPAPPRSHSFRRFQLSPERTLPGTSSSENLAQGGMTKIAKSEATNVPFPDLDIRKQSSKESSIRYQSPPSPPLSAFQSRRTKRLARHELMRRRDTTSHIGETVLDDRMLYPCNRRGKHDCRCALEDEEEEQGEKKDKSGTVARQSNFKKKATTSWQKAIQEQLPKNSENNNVAKKELIKSMNASGDVKNSSVNDNTWPKGFSGPSHPNGRPSSKDSLTLPPHEFTHVLTVLRDRNSCPAINGATLKKLPESKKISKCDTNNSLGWPASPTEFYCDKVPSSTLANTIADSCDLPGEQVDPKTNPPEQVEKNTLSNWAIPTAKDKARFRRRLDSAANMVFHSRTGLPLTSSPAPIRRVHGFGEPISRFEYDSSINSVASIESALFEANSKNNGALNEELHRLNSSDLESISIASSDDSGSPNSPGGSQDGPESPTFETPTRRKHRRRPAILLPPPARLASATYTTLLGTFEESVLNGRMEPVSTIQGFTAELGASGSFCPEHIFLPVTVFFYSFGDNDKVSSPYLAHINLGKKGYQVPRCGTVQVTLFNPLGTVIKMFVVRYDLSDMPNNSQTFIRQRTLYLPPGAVDSRDVPPADSQKWLRYLIHLRFSSSKSGRISLHTDIRMIVLRKSDHDTATAHEGDYPAWELRSFNHGPTYPKFSRL